jgi:hypothetical protein
MGGQRAGVRGAEEVTGRPAHKKPPHAARPIKAKRDFEAATEVAKRLAAHAARDDAAERRLQALLHEMDKFDEPEDDAPEPPEEDFGAPGHARRWSDGGADES